MSFLFGLGIGVVVGIVISLTYYGYLNQGDFSALH